MEEELGFHLEARAADRMREGLSATEAARQARLEFGGMATHKDAMRRSLGLRWFDDLMADLRYGTRVLKGSPGFTLIAVASLALAIGANTTIFSVANQLLYARLGVPHPEQLRLLFWSGKKKSVVHSMWGSWYPNGTGGTKSESFSYPVYQQLRKENRSLNDLFAFKNIGRVNVTVNGEAQSVQADTVSGNFYAEMLTKPQLGRPILPSDDGETGSGAVVVISEGFWERAYGRAPDVIGKVITVNMTPVTIVGINEHGFTGAKSAQTSSELFLPMSLMPLVFGSMGDKVPLLSNTEVFWVQIMGRMRPGISDRQAQAALDVALNAAIRGTMKIDAGRDVPHLLLNDGSKGINENGQNFAKPMYVLLTMTGLVLLLACANTANLLLARAAVRNREVTVRLALGASRGRVVRQVITESLMLSAMGGACGLVLGYFGRTVLPRMMTSSWERNDLSVPFDFKVFGFTAGITLLTGLLFGLAPALAATRANVATGLKGTAQTTTRRRKGWSGRAIVAFQLTLSTLLVAGSALFLRTLVKLNSVHPGFRTDHLVLFDINPPDRRYPAPKDIALHHQIEEELAGVTGVDAVSVTDEPLLADDISKLPLIPEGATMPEKPEDSAMAMVANVGDRFFPAMGLPIVAGRGFTAQDSEGVQKVSVINQTLARTFWPGMNPVGKRFRTSPGPSDGQWIEVIGVCADTRYSNLRDEPPPLHFDLYRQQSSAGGMTYIVRTSLAPETIAPSLRAAVRKIDRDLPLLDVRTQQEQIDATLQQERLFASLTAGFGVLALALACVGIYGIMAYTVSQRTNEIGIRLALGARRTQVRGIVLQETGCLALAGIVVGLGIALALGRLVKSMLYEVRPADPLSLLATAGLLIAVALLAGWGPAARASRLEPMEALRHD